MLYMLKTIFLSEVYLYKAPRNLITKSSYHKKTDVNTLCKFPSLLQCIKYSVLITEFIGNIFFHLHIFKFSSHRGGGRVQNCPILHDIVHEWSLI